MYSQSDQIMTCLEHELLNQAQFKQTQDFQFLLLHDYPCFQIVFRSGQPCLLVKHFLAKIWLPSGIYIEILPKISSVNANDHTSSSKRQSITESRRWVAQMLSDIAHDSIAKQFSVINSNHLDDNSINNDHVHTLDTKQFNDYDRINYQRLERLPWYISLLKIASKKISAAASVLPNSYQTYTNNGTKASGKIDLKQQLKHNWYRPHYVYSKRPTLQTDELIEQFLATGWQQLNHQLMGSRFKQSQLVDIDLDYTAFKNVKTIPRHLWQTSSNQLLMHKPLWQGQLTTQQSKLLSDAIKWCDWILNHLPLMVTTLNSETQENAYTVASKSDITPFGMTIDSQAIMINMNHAFEKWVTIKLKKWTKQHYPDCQFMLQPKLDWLTVFTKGDGSKQVPDTDEKGLNNIVVQKLIPDACIVSKNGQVTHVIDIKYKVIDTLKDIKSSDWQQLYTYQQYLKAHNGWLIYPATDKFNQKQSVMATKVSHYDLYSQQQQVADHPILSAVPFDVINAKLKI